MSTGSSSVIIGSTSAANCLLGSQPVGMNSAVIRPHAMNAPMLGITMPARWPPRRWILAFRPLPVTWGVYGVAMRASPRGSVICDEV